MMHANKELFNFKNPPTRSMDLITPQFGLIFWQLIAFLVLLFVLSKYAWKPIMEGLKEREDSIELALKSAQEAKTEMANISARSESVV